MKDNTLDLNISNDNLTKAKFRARILELCLKLQKTLKDILELEEPTFEQKEFFVNKIKRGFSK